MGKINIDSSSLTKISVEETGLFAPNPKTLTSSDGTTAVTIVDLKLKVAVVGNRAYVADFDSVQVIDISSF